MKEPWDFVEKWFPNYFSSNIILQIEDLDKMLSEDFEKGVEGHIPIAENIALSDLSVEPGQAMAGGDIVHIHEIKARIEIGGHVSV